MQLREVSWLRYGFVGQRKLGMIHLTVDGKRTLCGRHLHDAEYDDLPARNHRCIVCQDLREKHE